MSIEQPLPEVGAWYKADGGESFEVVAFDEEEAYIEIQYFDGTVEELDLDTWNEQFIEPVEPPEDWSGSLDIERDDYGVDLGDTSHLDWHNPLDDFDR